MGERYHIAHRGIWRQHCVENSIRAIQASVDQELCGGCEIDLQLIDGQWVVFHDIDFSRFQQDKPLFNERGERLLIQDGFSDPLPRLQDLCDWVVAQSKPIDRIKRFMLNVEIKQYAGQRLASSDLLDLVTQLQRANHHHYIEIVYSSYDKEIVTTLLQLTAVTVGYLFKDFHDFSKADMLVNSRVSFIAIKHGMENMEQVVASIYQDYGCLAAIYFEDEADFQQFETLYNQDSRVQFIFAEFGL